MKKSELVEAWRTLARRHLSVAELLVRDYPDVAYFHVYHAFECSVTARLTSLYPATPSAYGHSDRVFDYLDRESDPNLSQQAESMAQKLDRRNQSLYIGLARGRIRRPQDQFDSRRVERLLDEVRSFLDDLELDRGP